MTVGVLKVHLFALVPGGLEHAPVQVLRVVQQDLAQRGWRDLEGILDHAGARRVGPRLCRGRHGPGRENEKRKGPRATRHARILAALTHLDNAGEGVLSATRWSGGSRSSRDDRLRGDRGRGPRGATGPAHFVHPRGHNHREHHQEIADEEAGGEAAGVIMADLPVVFGIAGQRRAAFDRVRGHRAHEPQEARAREGEPGARHGQTGDPDHLFAISRPAHPPEYTAGRGLQPEKRYNPRAMHNLWRDEEARGLSGIDLLVYRSRLIGSDTGLVVWGGGNTSIKHQESDFRGRRVRVMRVKGSGSDLKTIRAEQFPGIRLDDLETLEQRDSMTDEEMVAYLVHCLMEHGSPRPSIETLLHGFVPHPHIDHTHADAILALTNTNDGRKHVEAVYGQESIWIAYRRPGFTLSREVAEAVRSRPKARCVALEKHGLITWGQTAKESYDATIEMNTRAEEYARDRGKGKAVFGSRARAALSRNERRAVVAGIAPYLRGLLSGRTPDGAGGPADRDGRARVVLRHDDGDDVLEFTCSEAAPQLCLA